MSTLTEFLRGAGKTAATFLGKSKEVELPKSVVTHDPLDDYVLEDFTERSARFRRATTENAPRITPKIDLPPPPDFTDPELKEEIAEWQAMAKKKKDAERNAPEYTRWSDLTGDMFRAYHAHDTPELIERVDPGVELHKRILPKMLMQDEFAEARDITRDDGALAAMATIAATEKLKELLDDDGELHEQAQESQEIEDERAKAQGCEQQLVPLREEAGALKETGQPIPQPLVERIKALVREKRGAAGRATQIADNPTPMGTEAIEAIGEVAQAGQEAAQAAKDVPGFGAGLGKGEPTYESPEQQISIAEQWSQNPELRAMAEMFGKMDRDIRFHRSKRIVGGQDEIVDVKLGDELRRVLPSEFGLLSTPDTEDDFWGRYTTKELLQYETVGEEHAGRGPILMVLDGSGSMRGERNIWARATALCLLHIARAEKRDFGLIEFSGGGQLEEWIFRAKDDMLAQKVLDMASHLFGGGTAPVIGVTQAAKVMKESPTFKKADLVLVGDGEAGFGAEDERLRKELTELGVRLFGIGVGGSLAYLEKYCEHVVNVHDFELTDPGAATAELATHIT